MSDNSSGGGGGGTNYTAAFQGGAAAVGAFGSALGDLFAERSATAAAESYGEAATLEGQNVQIAEASGKLQEDAERRQVYRSLSGTQSDVAGAGLKLSGSALNVLRSSTQQGALAGALVSEQTALNVAGYEEQQMAYERQEAQEKGLASADKAGAIINGISGAGDVAAMIAALFA